MNPLTRLAGRIGVQRVGPAAGAVAAVLILAGGSVLFAATSPAAPGWLGGARDPVQVITVADDADADGLPDAVENRIGSDPRRPSTLGAEVPDGWLYNWYGDGIDWEDVHWLDAPALAPPSGSLPAAFAGQPLALPTLRDLYRDGAQRAAAGGLAGAWWLQSAGLDPRNWDNNGDGVADAWLLQHGLDPLRTDADGPSPASPGLTVRAKYQRGLDPTRADSDGDGLLDEEELNGRARLAGADRTFVPTDPRLFAQRSDGVPDGLVVLAGVDPADATAANRTLVPGGLTVREAFESTRSRCPGSGCDWRALLETGPVVDPSKVDSLGDGAPDSWEHRDPDGVAHPLVDSSTLVLDDTRLWDQDPWDGDPVDLSGVVVDRLNPPPAKPATVTALDAYRHLRPAHWDEARDGPWLEGLPTRLEALNGSLPAAVSLRGWSLEVDAGLGGRRDVRSVHATANPRLTDSDGDGLPDRNEYFGVLPGGLRVNRTNALDADSDGDGLPDGLETPTALLSDPLRRDTAGSFLPDGAKAAYWLLRHANATAAFQEDPEAARAAYAWLADTGELDIERLRPERSLLGGKPNMLTADVDGDGMKDGEELFPNQFLEPPSANVRPATDPARSDSDGDALPDIWEVGWSKDIYFNCKRPCDAPVKVAGWPLNPSRRLSVPIPLKPGQDLTDSGVNLANDGLANSTVAFSNGLAYKYGLNPYTVDHNGDGIPNTFAIHWGIENVPRGGEDGPDIPGIVAKDRDRYRWATEARNRLAPAVEQRGFSLPAGTPVVIDPLAAPDDPDLPLPVRRDQDLLSLFGLPAKGVWRAVPSAQCLPKPLPPERVQSLPASDPRQGLGKGCWEWSSYPLDADIRFGTNPWKADTDGDGLLDAWEATHGVRDRFADDATQASIDSGCREPARTASLPGPHCITYLDAYLLGLDPNRADTDGGGLEDWYELALSRVSPEPFNPRDDTDDHGERDWDGDGLLNKDEDRGGTSRLDPDSDRDGLADGGDLSNTGTAKGDLCIARHGDTPLDLTTGRPGGRLTQAQLYTLYEGSGILRRHDGLNGCPDGKVRFFSEGVVDPAEGTAQGAGRGTDPRRWSTGNDTLPDGWKVQYRELSQSGLEPHPLEARFPVPPSQTSDTDLLPDILEYRFGRPDGWREAEDGPWWGGLDPTRADTDGDRTWFANPLHGDDDAPLPDTDLDGDGLGPTDPDPIRAGSATPLVTRNAAGRFVTDHPALFAALEQREGSFARDGTDAGVTGGDRVPDFLDRARLHLSDPVVAATTLEKGAPFQVAGAVALAEEPGSAAYAPAAGLDVPHAPGDARVAGVSVKAYLVDAAGTAFLVGAGFTGDDGTYSLVAKVADPVQAGPLPADGGCIEGRCGAPGDGPLVLPSQSPLLLPGDLRLVVVAEANDAALQPVRFVAGGTAHGGADAYKRFTGGTFTTPRGDVLRSVLLNADGDGPGPPQSVHHVAEAVFEGRSSAVDVTLGARAQLSLDLPAGPVLLGRPVNVTGLLGDGTAPLPDRDVALSLAQAGRPPVAAAARTDADGAFRVQLPSHTLQVGPATLSATVDVAPPLLPPQPHPTTATVQIGLVSRWQEGSVRLNGVPLSSGHPFDVRQPFRFSAVLHDHDGVPLPGRDATVSLLDGGKSVVQASGRTAADGTLAVDLQLPAALPTRLVQVQAAAAPATGNVHEAYGQLLQPLHPTRLVLADAAFPAGQNGTLEGTLLRDGDLPVTLEQATFKVRAPDGGSSVFTGPVVAGSFRVPLPAAAHGVGRWEVAYAGSASLFPSPPQAATVVRVAETRLHLAPEPALRSQPATIAGRLGLADGSPLAGQVLLAWSDKPDATVAAVAERSGAFRAVLPARSATGMAQVEARYLGQPDLRPSFATAKVDVDAATRIDLAPRRTTVDPTGRVDGPLLEGVLGDDLGPLPGRTVTLELRAADGNAKSILLNSDNAGRFRLQGGSLALDGGRTLLSVAGPLQVAVSYAGGSTERPSKAAATVELVHQARLVATRLPAAVDSGGILEIAGVLETAARDARPALVVLGFNQARFDTSASLGGSWAFRLRVPPLPRGTYTLGVEGWVPGQAVQPLLAQVTVQSPLDLQMLETELEGGSRTLDLRLSSDAGSLPEDGVQLIVVRTAQDGTVLGAHNVTVGRDGKARLELQASEAGLLAASMRRDPEAYLASSTHDIQPIAYTVVTAGGPSLLWPLVAGLAVLAGAACAVAAWLWRRRQKETLAQAVQESHRLVLDAALPVREAVRRIYRHFLHALTAAGYRPRDSETVRDIAERAAQAFRLPQRPMEELTLLFETADYAAVPMPVGDRGRALRALRELGGHLGVPLGEVPPA